MVCLLDSNAIAKSNKNVNNNDNRNSITIKFPNELVYAIICIAFGWWLGVILPYSKEFIVNNYKVLLFLVFIVIGSILGSWISTLTKPKYKYYRNLDVAEIMRIVFVMVYSVIITTCIGLL